MSRIKVERKSIFIKSMSTKYFLGKASLEINYENASIYSIISGIHRISSYVNKDKDGCYLLFEGWVDVKYKKNLSPFVFNHSYARFTKYYLSTS